MMKMTKKNRQIERKQIFTIFFMIFAGHQVKMERGQDFGTPT